MSNTKSTKRALVSSIMAMLLCVAMLIGTTFAWFTDSVTSSGNKIQSGTLNIDLLVKNAEGVYESVKNTQDAIFDYDLWEPGYTEVRNVKVTTTGNLALKYTLKIVPQSATEDALKLAEVIDVYYANREVTVENRDLSGLTRIGTLKEIFTAETVINDTLIPDSNTEDFATIVLKMQESAGNDYQNLSVGGGFDLRVLATQYTYENDSFDNSYDNRAVYEEDVQVEDQPWHELDAVQADTVVDGGGNTYAADYQEVALVGNADLTIKGVTFQNGLTIYTTYEAAGTIRLENCTIYLNNGNGNPSNTSMTQNKSGYGLNIGAVSPNVTWEFVNCKFTAYDNHDFTSAGNSYNAYIGGNYSADSISFNGCTFEGDGRHGIGCSYSYGPEQAAIPFTYYNLNVTGCNFVNWNNYNPNNNGAAIRGNVPADVLTQFSKSINISGNTFGNSNGSTQNTVAIDGWSGSWN